MNITKVTDGVHKLTINEKDILFEGIWPVPRGVSMNSYLIEGDEVAAIDGISGWNGEREHLEKIFSDVGISIDKLKYLVINHMEPDHTSLLNNFKELNIDIKIICNKKSVSLLEDFYGVHDNIEVVKDGDTIDLGKGHILEFYETPNVHWPETMVTFDKKALTLFSCDAFGGFGAIDENGYDDLQTEENLRMYEAEAVRYYSNIIGGLTTFVRKAIDKCSNLDIKIIAPGHGLVWRKNPERIVSDYIRYANYQANPEKEAITIIWGSMYGMTKIAKDKVEEILKRENIEYYIHRVPEENIGDILASCWNSKGVILGMPTYEYRMFPPMAAILDELNRKKVQNRIALRFGSFGWSGGCEKELKEIDEKAKLDWEFLPSVEFKGTPKEADMEKLESAVMELIAKIRIDGNK